jgi:hypothetical protein
LRAEKTGRKDTHSNATPSIAGPLVRPRRLVESRILLGFQRIVVEFLDIRG